MYSPVTSGSFPQRAAPVEALAVGVIGGAAAYPID